MQNILLTSSAEHLAENLKKKGKNLNLVCLGKNKDNSRIFPDGEVYVKIPEIGKLKGKKVVVIHSGQPAPNEGLLELELALQILKENSVEIEIFFTYFSYGMQDDIFEKGESNFAKNLLNKFFAFYGVKKIFILDPHFGKREWLNKYKITNVSAVPLLIEKAREDFGQDILLLSADKGGKRRTGIAGADKKRTNSFDVKFLSCNINFEDKNVAVVDDLVETGGTLVKFRKLAKDSGAKKVVALLTHGVLPEGIKKVKKSYDKLYLTNSINRKEANVDITDLILENI